MARAGDPRALRVAACPDVDGSCDRVHGSALSWSPDGTRLAVAGDGSIWVAPVSGNQPFHRITGCRTCVDRQPSWSPDGTTIAFASERGVFEIGVGDGVVRRLAPPGPEFPVWSPDGTRLVVAAGGGVYLVDTTVPRAVPPLISPPQGVDAGPGNPSWSPEGTEVVWFSTPGHGGRYVPEVWVTRLAGHRSHRVFRGPCCVDLWTPPLWSPDGRRIALGLGWSRGRTAGGIATFVLDADGRNVHRLPASSEELAWRPSLR